MKISITWFVLIFIILISCSKFAVENTGSIETESIDNLRTDPGFTFNTAKDVAVKFTTLDNTDNPVPGIRLNIYTDYPDNGGRLVASFRTGNDGTISGAIRLPAFTDPITIETAAIGFVNIRKRSIPATSALFSCTPGAGKTLESEKASLSII